MDIRRQYITRPSSHENSTSSEKAHDDADNPSTREPLTDVHALKLNSGITTTTKQKGKDAQRSKPAKEVVKDTMGGSSSSHENAMQVWDDEELEEIEKGLNDIWGLQGMDE